MASHKLNPAWIQVY